MRPRCLFRLLTGALPIAIAIGSIFSISCSSRTEQELADVPLEGMLSSDACQKPTNSGEFITISALISDPEKYDGRYITLEGFYYSGFELSAISARRQGSKELVVDDAIWVTGISPFAEIAEQRVRISGIADAKQKGHLGLWPASICASEIKLLPDPG